MAVGKLRHLALSVEDPEETAKFYMSVLVWRK